MSLSARLFERANRVRHDIQVHTATQRDLSRHDVRRTASLCVPGPERLEDRILLSSTLISDPIDHGFIFDYVGSATETIHDIHSENEANALIATNGAAIGLNFAGRTSGFNPPDTMGMVGPDHIVELINGAYAVYNKLDGSLITNSSLNTFWANSGVTHNNSFDPRVLYDSTRNRFYASSVNNGRNDNEILFAISNTSDPTDGWTGFKVDSDSQNGQRWADFPQMSFDDDGVYIGVNMFDQDGNNPPVYSSTRTTWVLPLADLTDGTPSIENATLIEDHQSITGASAQGVVYDSGGGGLPAVFLRGEGDEIVRSQLDGPVTSPSFSDLADIAVTSRNSPPLAEQPNDDGLEALQTGGTRIRSKVDYMNNAYWGVQGVDDSGTGNAALRFFEISTGGTLNQEVFISHTTLDLFYASIAVNSNEDMVIGFSASGPNAGQFPSAYAVIGDTTAGNTTFGTIFELEAGTATYQRLDTGGRNRWGDYSATVLDPSDSNVFWTFQEYCTGLTNWGTKITQIILDGTPGVDGYVDLNPFGDATLTNSIGTDVFAFALDLDGNTQINVDDNGGSLDAGLRLWDFEDDMIVDVDLDTNDDDPQINESLSSWNLYAAEIFSENSSGSFTLSIDGPTPSVSTTSLDADGDATRTSSIGGGGNDAGYYSFVAPSAGDLALTLTPDAGSGLNGVLTLYDSTGGQLIRANGGGSEAAETINYTGAVAGETYYARVGAHNYESDGNYTLDVDFDLPLPTTWSTSVEGFATMHRDGFSHDVLSFDANMSSAGDIDSYYFGSDTAGTVTIDVDDFGNAVDPIVAIYNASTGTLLGWDNDSGSGDNAQISVDISSDTRYIVAVADDNLTDTGDLGITIDTPMNWTGSNIVIGIDGNGTSTSPNIHSADSDFLRFTTPANTIGTGSVTVTPAATLDVEFVMFDAAGNELDRGNPSSTGNPSSFSYNGFAPNTEYYLTIHSDDYETNGNVTLVEVDLDLYGEIHGTKFYDRDQDGIWDPGEESLPGWTIYLDENNNGVPDPGEPMTVTDENGEYAFTNLLAGTQVVSEILKPGWTQTAPGDAHTVWTSNWAAQPKNVIFFVGDGMGPEQVKAGGMYANGTAGTLSFEGFANQGKLTTHSADNAVTDSAAAGTALATGYKVNNTVISRAMPANGNYVYGADMQTLLEYFQTLDKSIGLVTTTTMTHATPAAFGAHQDDRYQYNGIASNYLNDSRPNLLLGGGANGMTVPSAQVAGYTVVTDRVGLLGVVDNGSTVPMISGQFGTTHLPYEHDGLGLLPHLSEMTGKALDLLDNDSEGFFLMVEGGRIDHAGHMSNADLSLKTLRNVKETIAFSNAVQEAIDWASGRTDSLILVTADHETGGLAVIGNNGEGNLPSVTWIGGNHTATNVPVYAWGVNADMVSGTMDNTEMWNVATALGHAQTVTGVDFGNYAPPGEIHGIKFHDDNGNGIRERGELGLAGWLIYLDLDRDGTFEDGEPFDITDGTGTYSFTDLVPGSYTVAEVQQNGFVQTGPNTDPYRLAGPGGIAASGSNQWAWDNAHLADFRAAVDDASNFGANGIFNREVLTANVATPNAAALSTVDGFVSPWWLAADSTPFHADIENFFFGGGDLILLNDVDNRDGVATTLGIPTFTSSDPIVYIDQDRYVHAAAYPYGGESAQQTESASGFETFSADLVASAYVEDDFYFIEGSASQESSLNPTSIVATGNATGEEGPPVGTSLGGGNSYMEVTFRVNESVDYTLDASFMNSWYGEFEIAGPNLMIFEDFKSASEYEIATSGTLEPGDYTVQIDLVADALDLDEVSFEFELVFVPGLNSSPANGWAPFFDGAFGTAHDVQQSQDGQLDPLHVAATGGTIVALNASGQVTAAYWDPGAYAPGAGALLITTDVDMISTQADYAPLNDNGIFALNAVSAIVDLHGTHQVFVGAGQVVTGLAFGNRDDEPPQVTDILVRGSTWTQAYLDHLQAVNLGNGGYAIPVGSAAQLHALPFANVEEVIIRFSEAVDIDLNDVRLVGVLGPDGIDDGADGYNLTNLTTGTGPTGYFEAVVEINASIDTDKLLLTVFDSTTDLVGNHLDGEWTDGASVFASGNAGEGGNFSFRFNVLPGDITQNNTVEGTDLSVMIGSWLQNVPPAPPLAAITGDASIGPGDLSVILGHWLTSLPTGTPANATGGNPVSALLGNAEAAGRFGAFGVGTARRWRSIRSTVNSVSPVDDGEVDLLATSPGRTVVIAPSNHLAG